MALNLIFDGAETARATIVLAHGAGAPMDSPWMNTMAKALAAAGLRVARFEFGYMAARREGVRKAPPRADLLVPNYLAAVDQLHGERPLIIGGKSMGGRVASMVCDDLYAAGRIVGLLCLGYPFHPPGKPGQLRTKHLADLKTPTLICQGTRDPFGTRQEVSGYDLSERVKVFWLEDGDHDLKPASCPRYPAPPHCHLRSPRKPASLETSSAIIPIAALPSGKHQRKAHPSAGEQQPHVWDVELVCYAVLLYIGAVRRPMRGNGPSIA